jgi:hypothetical protein
MPTRYIEVPKAENMKLSDGEAERLETNYTPRRDHQNIFGPKALSTHVTQHFDPS